MALKRLATAVIEIATDSTKFDKGVESLAKGLRALNIDPTTKGLREFGRSATDAGSALTKGLTLPIIGAGAFAVKTASDFESSFAGVRKTVNATEAEFAALSRGFRDMAKTIPVNVNELNKIGEAAGQLGIKTDNILGFTRVMADLGVATNLSSEEAATSLARLANITQMPQDSFDRLGSTIVGLGNNFATTESEIVSMALRIAGAGKQVGLSEHQILAVGAALSSVGIEAEAGGSAISKVMIDMASEVEKGGKKLALYSAIAGVDFKKAFQQDAAGALNLFVKGLADTERTGVSTLTALEALGITEVRMRDALLRASGAGDLMNKALDSGAVLWSENNALTNEAAERYKTFASRATILWNTVQDVAITIGTSLMPIIQSLMEALKPAIEHVARWAEGFAKLPKPIQMMALGIGSIAAAIGPVLLVVGQLAMGLAAIAPWIAAGTKGAALLAGAINLLLNPIAWVVAAIVGMVVVWKVWGEDIKRIVSNTISAVKTWLVDKFGPILRPVRDLLRSIGEMFSAFGKLVGAVFGIVVREVSEAVIALGGWLRDKLSPIIDPAIALFHGLQTAVGIVATGVIGFAKSIYEGVKGWMLDKFTSIVNGIRAQVEAVTGVFKWMYDAVVGHSYVPDMMKGITSSFAELEGGMVAPTVAATGKVTQAFKEQTEAQRLVAEALGTTAKVTKTKLTPAQKEAAAAALEHKEAVESLRAELSGDRAAGDVALLAEAFSKLTPEQRANKEVIANLLAQYTQLRSQVTDKSKLPAELENLQRKFLSIAGIVEINTGAIAGFGTEVTLQTDAVSQAFERMGVQTRGALKKTAEQALSDYRLIAASGMASAAQLTAAWEKVEDAQRAAAEDGKLSWGDFKEQFNEDFLGGKGVVGILEQVGMQAFPKFTKGVQFALEAASAAARAFAGDWSGVMALVSQHFDKIVEFAAKGIRKLGEKLGELSKGWKIALTALVPPLGVLAWAFGGPSANEKAGREVAKQFKDTVASMMNERQTLEAGNNEWAKSVIVVRDAYLAMGKTEAEALAAMDRLWKAEKEGAGSVEEAIKPIQAALDWVGKQAEETGLSLDELRARGMETGKTLASSIADASREIEIVGDAGESLADRLRKSLGGLKFDIPIGMGSTGGLELPVVPMADGGFGRATRPTLFYSGGQEDFAFSGEGKRFGVGGGSNGGGPLQIDVNIDGRRAARAIVPHLPGAVGALA